MITSADYAKAQRWRSTAQTWIEKAVAMLAWCGQQTTNTDVLGGLGIEAHALLHRVLWDAGTLVPLIRDEDDLEDVERAARDLTATIRAQRLRGKLAHVEGRTTEEAAAFRAKADTLGRS